MRRISFLTCLLPAVLLAAACEPPPRSQVQATASGSLVVLPGDQAALHARVYSDRVYTFTRLGGLAGMRFLATANEDKAIAARHFLELQAGRRTTVVLAFDRRPGARAAPAWLAEEGFQHAPPCDSAHFDVATTDGGARFEVWCRPPRAVSRLTLGGNVDQPLDPTAALSMYLIFYDGELSALGSIDHAARAQASQASVPPRQVTVHGADALCQGLRPPGAAELVRWSRSVPRPRADLRCADLRHLDLSSASFDLSGADLIAAKLQFANLSTAILDDAEMEYAHLADATLARTSLRRANLIDADLSRARLVGADLSDADLSGARLEDADFTGAQLDRLLFEPSALPAVRQMARARGLDRLRYRSFPDALIALRDSFKKAGFRGEERQVTAALERQTMALAPRYERWARRVLLGMTCDYGLAVNRPLLLIAASIFLFPLLYHLCARWIPGSSLQLIDGDKPSSPPRDLPAGRRWPYYFQLSLSSAFALSGPFQIGTWIQSLRPSTDTLRVRGVLRTLSGLQSLLCLLLLALWALIFLGRPFE
jgi:hypothetical protein